MHLGKRGGREVREKREGKGRKRIHNHCNITALEFPFVLFEGEAHCGRFFSYFMFSPLSISLHRENIYIPLLFRRERERERERTLMIMGEEGDTKAKL